MYTYHNGVFCRVFAGTKEECIKSLSQIPRYDSQVQISENLWHYYYLATKEEEQAYQDSKMEDMRMDADMDLLLSA